MKWDFFYDEDNKRPYRSLKDWYRDIRHLILPLIIMLAMILWIYFHHFI
ncbi:hypothetical protein KI659_10815 [Litoribacter alkaliphilus]|uniref:Uncharacterized protein n=1 Tax=Litoribacter ruber TaxID=702568 RepID=A0AAP2CHY6_9BACT|nr:hypothetical protein [Litoribacter alkaliphilus]MBS9524507.1 hypothetical protein [Litoribacter alkaliphilus]